MYGLTRGTMTLIGVAAAGFLLWLAAQFSAEGNDEYWLRMGVIAGAGLTIAFSQVLGGWTKWGRPRVSGLVFLLGFLPALVAGGLVLLHLQPDGGFGSTWMGDLGLAGLADDLEGVLPAVAFLIGLTFGLTFDTTGPRVADRAVERGEAVDEPRYAGPVPVGYGDSDERVTADGRHTDGQYSDGRYADEAGERRYAGPVPVDRRDADEPTAAERTEVAAATDDERRDRYEDETVVRDGDRDYAEAGAPRRREHDVRGDGRHDGTRGDGSYREHRAEADEPRWRKIFRR